MVSTRLKSSFEKSLLDSEKWIGTSNESKYSLNSEREFTHKRGITEGEECAEDRRIAEVILRLQMIASASQFLLRTEYIFMARGYFTAQ